MSNISIQLKNFSHNFLVFKKNFVVLFYLGFLVLVVFEFFVVKNSLNLVLESKGEQPPSRSVQKVRINFIDYDSNFKRLQEKQDFKPSLEPAQNPFQSK